MRRTVRRLTVPLGPDRGHTHLTAGIGEDLSRTIDIRAAGIVHELDLQLEGQLRPPCTPRARTHRGGLGVAGILRPAQRTTVI